MTSTSTFQGMDPENKPSSRVLAPPGGGSSNIFGGSSPVQAPRPKKEVNPPPAQAPQPAPAAPGARNIRSAPKQAYNPITGEPYEVKEKAKEEPAAAAPAEQEGKENEAVSVETKPAAPAAAVAASEKERPSTRVVMPPGGKSSGLW